MDMVGGLLATTKGTLHVSRAVESHPHVVNEIARAWLDQVTRGLAALRGEGRRSPGRLRLAAGVARAAARRPARLRDRQRPRGLRGGELRRPDGLLPRLPRRHDPHQQGPAREPRRHEARARGVHGSRDRLDARRAAGRRGAAPPALRARAGRGGDRALARRARTATACSASAEAIATAQETLRSVAALWPSTAAAVAKEDERLREMASLVRPPDRRRRRRACPGPQPGGPRPARRLLLQPAHRRAGPRRDRAAGALPTRAGRRARRTRRSTSSTESGASPRSGTRSPGRYEPVPVAEVAEYLNLLATARVVTWK